MELIKPKIFPQNVIAGVVTANRTDHPINGFSIKEGDVHSFPEVEKMRKDLALFLGVHPLDMAYQDQVHGDTIRMVDNEYEQGESDAMISYLKRKILNVAVADCAGVLIYCPDKKIVSAIHSGWKGTEAKITSKTINKLRSEFNCEPSEMLVYISPCASVSKYEVGKEFQEIFPKTTIKKDGTYYFDNRSEIQEQLISSGVKLRNIEISQKCTISDPNLHSYRRDGKKSGRMSVFIGLK